MKRTMLPRGTIPSPEEQRKVFGTRTIVDWTNIYDHNAWDDPSWTEEDEYKAKLSVKYQTENPVSEDRRVEYSRSPERYWDSFYEKHEDKFFKDRKWIPIECPEFFYDATDLPIIKPLKILELGCGVGNTIIPLLSYKGKESEGLLIRGVDYSQVAIDIAKKNKNNSDIWDVKTLDITKNNLNEDTFFKGILFDVCFCVFVLSAIEPTSHKKVVENIFKLLKPGGTVVIRDYAEKDMVQLRFKKDRLLGNNFYVRGDGTRVYFFSTEKISTLFDDSKFELVYNNYDKRLLLNRSRMLKMHRIWVSSMFRRK